MKGKAYWKEWAAAAAIRAIKTFGQAAASLFTVGSPFNEINLKYIASVAAVSAVYSLLTSIAGLPEVTEGADKA